MPIAKNVFFYLLLLTGFFVLLEISLFIQNYRDFLSESTSVSGGLHLPLAFLPQIFLFVVIQLLIHFAYCILVWGISLSILKLFPSYSLDAVYFAMGIWLFGLLTALVANDVFYPNSKFSELIHIFLVNFSIAKIVFIILLLGCVFFITLAVLSLVLHKQWLLMIASSTITLIYMADFSAANVQQKLPQPNIIVVGIDALRPDFMGFFGRETVTPFIDSFLSRAVVFSQAVTPLARTFPSWTSILTGRYPKEVNIRTNLAKQQYANLANTLPSILRDRGYFTLFATDETRFSNIGTHFGFDRIVTPSIGLSDFLLGTINDFPFSNFLINTTLGKWIFPYSYGNRAAYITYQPNSFLNLIRPHLKESKNVPLLLAIHFCLPHYPYLWSDLPGQDNKIVEHYQKSIERVDQQLHSFFITLKHYGLLEHAIVVLLSDHGEALEFSGDRITEAELFLTLNRKGMNIPSFYPTSDHKETINQSAGHGTDVLGLPQYHSLLAIKLYGVNKQQARIIANTVSLLDIKPTILDLLGIEPLASSGQSLAQFVNGKHDISFKHRPIFLETDFSPPAIRTVFPDTHQVLLEGVNIFEVDPQTFQLVVKKDMNRMIIKSKQYAVIEDEWMLALYPQHQNDRMPILINLKTGVWTNDMRSAFAKSSPARRLLILLKMFYEDELSKLYM